MDHPKWRKECMVTGALLGVEFFFIVWIALIFGDCTEVSCVILPALHVELMFDAAFEALSAVEWCLSLEAVLV